MTCHYCGEEKPEESFSPSRIKYRKKKCRACASASFKEYYQKRWNSDPEFRKRKIEQSISWAKKNPEARAKIARRRNKKAYAENSEKIIARACIRQQVLRGNRPPAETLACESCGKQAEQYHHKSGYSGLARYDVVPLCEPCHARVHLNLAI